MLMCKQTHYRWFGHYQFKEDEEPGRIKWFCDFTGRENGGIRKTGRGISRVNLFIYCKIKMLIKNFRYGDFSGG